MTDFEIVRDDLFLDALAAGRLPDGADLAVSMLYALRAELDEPPVVVPLRRRTPMLVALAAAAGLVVGGVTAGAVVVADRPGELLYAAHRAVLGPTDHTTAGVNALLDQAAGRLARGDHAGARRFVARAVALLPSVPDADRATLRTRIADLTALAADPVPVATSSPDRHGSGSAPTPSRTAEPGDDKPTASPSSVETSGSDDHESASPTPDSDGHGESSSSDHSGSGD